MRCPVTTDVDLGEQTVLVLQAIAQQTGKTQDVLIREAVEQFIRHFQQTHRSALLRQARGMWQDREDLPALATLRAEMDRL
jgi:predicted transcriptional regulator